MRRFAICALIVGTLGLTGCRSSDDASMDASKPLDKMSKEEWCGFYQRYLAKPNIAPDVRQNDLKQMRARGCPSV